MFAVIRTGGKQYRVAADELLEVEKLAGEPGDSVTFADVLLLGGDEPRLGSPLVGGASVVAEIVEQGRGPKIIVFKKRRRQNSRRKNGHRQLFTLVRVTDILADGAKPKPARKAKAEKKPEPEIAETADAKASESKSAKRKSKAAAERAPSAEAAAEPKKPRARRAPKKGEGEGAKE
jgi:large subunit ribosomal protein L21